MKNLINSVTPPTLLTVNKFAEKHSAFSEGGLRFYIFNAKENGLEASGALVRLGRRVLINEPKFFAWIDSLQSSRRVQL